MFKPKAIYFEKEIENYELGKQLLEKYREVPKIEIENHNNIEEMRKKQNKEFMDMKRNLIIGVRKTHKFVENHKTSDYLVPYTSSGCTAACMYSSLRIDAYLVCVCKYNSAGSDGCEGCSLSYYSGSDSCCRIVSSSANYNCIC